MQHPAPSSILPARGWLCRLLVAAVFAPDWANAQTVRENVLYRNSYPNGYEWSDEILPEFFPDTPVVFRRGNDFRPSWLSGDAMIFRIPFCEDTQKDVHSVNAVLGDIEDKKRAGNRRKFVLKPSNQTIISAAIREVLDAKPQTKAA